LPPGFGGEPVRPGEAAEPHDIRILSHARTQLGFGEQTEIHVLLRDERGDPAVDERVSFGLRGRSQDASLSALDAVTDDEGEARVTLTAGDMAATFDVRVSAAGALDRHIGVAVSDSGFGSLHVDAPYDGRRDARERVVVVQADTSCDDHERSARDPSFTLLGDQERAEFLALPAATRYAVAGLAQGPTGVPLAWACVDGVEIDADRTTVVELSWSDGELTPAQRMTLDLELAAREPASWLRAALVRAAKDAVRLDAEGGSIGNHAEAHFLLDSLDATLRDDASDVDLADAILTARAVAGGALESSLQSTLVVHDAGPFAAIDTASRSLMCWPGCRRRTITAATWWRVPKAWDANCPTGIAGCVPESAPSCAIAACCSSAST
jgi:hypothetical protein